MMGSLSFDIDKYALLIAVIFIVAFLIIYKFKPTFSEPLLFFSRLKELQINKPDWRSRWISLPEKLLYGALALFLLAFIDPHFFVPKTGTDGLANEGIAIYLITDQSGSMTSKVVALDSTGRLVTIPKIDLLKQVTTQFVEGRPNDLIGLVAFARVAHVLSPLTLDHTIILNDLSKLKIVDNDNDDGTSIGYAIYKTASIIAATRHYADDLAGSDMPSYDIKSSIIILVTDGFNSPNPQDDNNPLRSMDPIEAAKYAKEKGVRVYLVNIEPALASAEFAPNRHQMQHVAEITGGKYYLIDNSKGLADIYGDINKLEKSKLPPQFEGNKDLMPQLYKRISLYPYLISFGMMCLIGSILLQTLFLRKVP